MNDLNAVALVVMTDGRDDVLRQTITSFKKKVTGLITARIIHDDSGDRAHQWHLQQLYRDWAVIGADERRGFGGAVRVARDHVSRFTTEPYVFWCEDDFTFKRHVYLDALISVLEVNPQLAQLALRRQPWNPEERRAGGIVEADPASFENRVNGVRGYEWLEHRKFYTTNPSLFPRRQLDLEWPEGGHSEGHFTRRCLDAGLTFGYWGARASGEWVEHIGHERTGTGY